MTYRTVYDPAYGNSRKAHIVIAECAIGRALPDGAHVHHANGNPRDNRPENLVICPSAAYHKLLHRRMRALDTCGHADWLRCVFCKRYDAPEKVTTFRRSNGVERSYHPACNAAASRAHRKAA
jgi:hypothetical protein